MNGADDWDELARTWQAQPVDLPRLRRATQWKTWRMRLVVASEVAATLFLLGFTWWAWERPGTTDLQRYWLLFWCVLLPLLQWLTLEARRGLWRPSEDSVVGLLRLRIGRAQAGVRLGRLTIGACGLMLLALAVWEPLYHQHHPPADPAEAARRLRMLAIAIGWLLLGAVGGWMYARRMRGEVARWRQVLSEVGEE